MSSQIDILNDIDRQYQYNQNISAEINMTPFVDVCLVLLIIFMVTAPFAVTGVNIQLPNVKAKSLPVTTKSLILTISKSGEFFLGKTKIDEFSLTAKIKEKAAETKNSAIFIRADKDVPYGKVLIGMNAAQKAGVQKIGMIGENKSHLNTRN